MSDRRIILMTEIISMEMHYISMSEVLDILKEVLKNDLQDKTTKELETIRSSYEPILTINNKTRH